MSLLFCGVVGPCRGEQNVKGKGLSKLFPQLCRRKDCLGQAENFKAPSELCCLKLSLVVRVLWLSAPECKVSSHHFVGQKNYSGEGTDKCFHNKGTLVFPVLMYI